MIRTRLDDATRSRLNTLRRSDLPAAARERIEMVFLSDAGWSPPRIATHLGYVEKSLAGRDWLLGDFTAADIQMSFVGEVARAFGRAADKPNLDGWITRLHARPARYVVALARAPVSAHVLRSWRLWRRAARATPRAPQGTCGASPRLMYAFCLANEAYGVFGSARRPSIRTRRRSSRCRRSRFTVNGSYCDASLRSMSAPTVR